MKKTFSVLIALLLGGVSFGSPLSSSVPKVRRSPAGMRAPAAAALQSVASGVGIQLDVVGRLVGGNNTLFRTAVDVANNTNTATQVDFYYDVAIGGVRVEFPGSITAAGIVAQGAGQLAAHSNFHSDDFVDDMRLAGTAIPGNLTSGEEAAGVLGSILFVYNSPQPGLFDQVGQGGATARFYSDGCAGTIGVSASGHELTSSEPTSLVGIARDTRGIANTPQLYTNFFIANEGYVSSTSGLYVANPVTIRLTGYSNATGQITGTYDVPGVIDVGETVGIGNLFTILNVNPAQDDTAIVFVDIRSGNSAISGLASVNDNGSKDPSASQLHPADWTAGR